MPTSWCCPMHKSAPVPSGACIHYQNHWIVTKQAQTSGNADAWSEIHALELKINKKAKRSGNGRAYTPMHYLDGWSFPCHVSTRMCRRTWSSLVPRPSLTAFFAAVAKSVVCEKSCEGRLGYEARHGPLRGYLIIRSFLHSNLILALTLRLYHPDLILQPWRKEMLSDFSPRLQKHSIGARKCGRPSLEAKLISRNWCNAGEKAARGSRPILAIEIVE